MPATGSYSAQYVDATRARVTEQLRTYRGFAAAATTDDATRAVQAWAPVYFASLVVGLEHAFVHRRVAAGGGATALDEVRTLAASIERHGGVLTVDPATPYDAGTAVLGVAEGSLIALDDDRFERLADAFLAEIEARYT